MARSSCSSRWIIVFSKLLVDWTKMLHVMSNNGGANVVGDWATWGCPFDLLHLQEKWTGDASTMQRDQIASHKTVGGDAISRCASSSSVIVPCSRIVPRSTQS